MQIKVRKAEPSDSAAINRLLYETWLDTYPNEQLGITREIIESFWEDRLTAEATEKGAKQIEESQESNEKTIIVAENDDTLCGVSVLLKEDNHNELKTIYVLPKYQRMGIGENLWKRALEWFDPGKPIVVKVADYNRKAIDFYWKLGFKETGNRSERVTLKDGVTIPEIEMVKTS